MKLLSKVMLVIAALVLVGLTSGTSYADGIVLVSPDIQKLVPPLAALNLQHHGNSTSETGGVSRRLGNGTSLLRLGPMADSGPGLVS